jgi:isoleucyl-tRNA synthetase
VPLFAGQARLDDNGKKGDANRPSSRARRGGHAAGARAAQALLSAFLALQEAVIFRNTPQWFIAMDKPIPEIGGDTLRDAALAASTRRASCRAPARTACAR